MASSRKYKAIFFDLDGTLLPMDVEVFLKDYFRSLGGYAAQCGMDAAALVKAVEVSVFAMMRHEPGVLNSQAFWAAFERSKPAARRILQRRARSAPCWKRAIRCI